MTTLVEDLTRPEALGEEPYTPVTLEETHISWVLLAGPSAYKVKKPVDLGFLDFSTLAARRAACDAEVALNRRLSPDVYHGVVPVTRGAEGRLRIGGAGPLVDWAVHMVRLDHAWRADHLVDDDRLRIEDIDRAAAHIAAFHAKLPPLVDPERYGGPAAVSRLVEQNFEQTRGLAERLISPAEITEAQAFQRRVVARADISARVAAGRVRDGHGDLRLEHLYFEPGGPLQIIDCVEFDPAYRVSDTAADVAFLAMDLTLHGREDLAERWLARYARDANDFDLYRVVDFWIAYRAWVRGKVAGIKGDHFTARRCLLLALAAARPSGAQARVVAVGGLIAAGKSTVADRLGAALAAPVIDADRTRKHLLGIAPTEARPDAAWQGAYAPGFSDRVYVEVRRRAREVLASGRPVILDASFRSAAERGRARDLARACGVPFHFVECQASAAVCKARLRARPAGVSDGRLEIFDAFSKRFEAVDELPAREHLVLDTTRPLGESLWQLRLWLRESGRVATRPLRRRGDRGASSGSVYRWTPARATDQRRY